MDRAYFNGWRYNRPGYPTAGGGVDIIWFEHPQVPLFFIWILIKPRRISTAVGRGQKLLLNGTDGCNPSALEELQLYH